jgi:hypothetical protein
MKYENKWYIILVLYYLKKILVFIYYTTILITAYKLKHQLSLALSFKSVIMWKLSSSKIKRNDARVIELVQNDCNILPNY